MSYIYIFIMCQCYRPMWLRSEKKVNVTNVGTKTEHKVPFCRTAVPTYAYISHSPCIKSDWYYLLQSLRDVNVVKYLKINAKMQNSLKTLDSETLQ